MPVTPRQWQDFTTRLHALPAPVQEDLVEKLVWIVDGFPLVFEDAATLAFVAAVHRIAAASARSRAGG